jgi:hypothetical protein
MCQCANALTELSPCLLALTDCFLPDRLRQDRQSPNLIILPLGRSTKESCTTKQRLAMSWSPSHVYNGEECKLSTLQMTGMDP